MSLPAAGKEGNTQICLQEVETYTQKAKCQALLSIYIIKPRQPGSTVEGGVFP